MLVPAIFYKREIEKQFAWRMYDDDMFYYQGYAHGHEMTEIEPQDNVYQWAIMGYSLRSCGYTQPIGYFAYRIDPATDNVYNFGLYSFDKGNALIGHDVFKKMEKLIEEHHRVEWRCVGGNKALRGYEIFLKRTAMKSPFYMVRTHTMTDVTKDNQGNYHDEHVFEIVNMEV